MTPKRLVVLAGSLMIASVITSSCRVVGPNYVKPPAPVPGAYHEALPPNFKEEGWKVGTPSDQLAKGKWWEIYNDAQLNGLEAQVNVTNQTIKAAEAQYREARASVQAVRAGLYPTVGGTAGVSGVRSPLGGSPSANAQMSLLGNVSWIPDLWGQVRRSIEASAASAQVSAADLENARLSLQADLATDYFLMRGLDAEKKLLDDSAADYQHALELTQNRFDQGVASGIDVAQAQTQLATTRAQATDTQVLRAQYEHAIAILVGKPPSDVSIAPQPLAALPPPLPGVLPSELLERRPDIAASERQMASANAQIGVAESAFYPSLSLALSAGIENTSLLDLFTWPSRFFSLGPTLSQTFFDAGRRRALTNEAKANYDTTVANYRQSVLNAFQQVEDNLAALRILNQESTEQADAVTAAQRSLSLALTQYQGGVTNYLQVITAQVTALSNETTAIQLVTRRMTANVNLIQALGGGWSTADLPTTAQVTAK